VLSTSPVFARPVAELALGLTLSLLRQIHTNHNNFINKKISRIGKLMQPVVVNKLDDIVWVPGLAHAKLPDESSLYKRMLLEWIPAL